MTAKGSENVHFGLAHVGAGGWASILVGGSIVFLRFVLTNDRLEPRELYVQDTTVLDRLSPSKIAGAVNATPDWRRAIASSISANEPAELGEYLSLALRDIERDLGTVRARNLRARPLRLRLKGMLDTAGRKPDSFYEQIAEAYASALRDQKHNPAALIAQANGVKASRVHGWIREARRRGLLPPADRQGRAG